MRIISGIYKGKRLNPPKNLPVRPTTDFAKEGLFNVLQNQLYFDELKVLDLFAGTGSITFEFASRGCEQIKCVDLNFKCVDFIRKTAKQLNFENIIVFKSNVFKYLGSGKESFDLIFADPPYDLENLESIPDLVFSNNKLNEDGLLIVEHSKKTDFSEHDKLIETRRYGNVNFSFFKE
ncbi:MAG: 16S rRNA (guanine(966)-N(2))-methyltransferase RsmD [Bacteroidetes bacterium]|nr:16S rRNA (guanine(966)-N(2))-methyltransferase RsmD [Bacteroidota bacterium]|tara:strand:- start:15 stop:548 length:534 start_codon:yes stop_codon:yes gene_type:complete